jgi:hypothetical protein
VTSPPPATSRPVPPTSTMLRPALALLAGLGITVALSAFGILVATLAALRGVDPRHFVAPLGYLLTNIVVVALAACAGGFATARITVGRSLFTVQVLALILLVSSLAPALRGARQNGEPVWFPFVLALMNPVGVLVGGLLQRRQQAR